MTSALVAMVTGWSEAASRRCARPELDLDMLIRLRPVFAIFAVVQSAHTPDPSVYRALCSAGRRRATVPPAKAGPPRASLGTVLLSLRCHFLVWGLLFFLPCSVSPSRAGASNLVLCFVSSAQPWATWHVRLGSILWKIEPREVRVLYSHSLLHPPLLRSLWIRFSPHPPPSPRFWPSHESWGGRWEEEGETGWLSRG